MEIVSAANLPKTPNVLRTGYDMDPFVVISFGKYIFRTRVVRHNCDPVWNAKLMFRVYHDEDSFLVKFSIHDWDKLSENDSVGTVTMPINDLIQAAGAQDDVLVNHPQSPLAMNGVPNIDPDMKDYIHTIVIDETVKVTAENPQLRVRAKFVPYTTLRRRFWYGLANAFGNDNHHGFYPKVLIQGMLENLGSTLSNETIDGFFEHFHKNPESDKLTFDELYERLEQRVKLDDGVVMKEPNLFKKLFRRSISKTQEGQNLRDMTDTSEHIIRISTCPICQDPSLGQKSETDVITHIAVCSGNDGFNLDKLIMGNFVTEENAQRKWITKFVKSLSFGQCIVGENNANIIVQERYKGLRTEEKMPTYIRLGIRLLYQGSGNKILANKFLANTSWRQGAKYNDPKSKRDIQPFIHFHQLDLHMAEEVLEPIQQFKNFNEFFYRKLKPGARTLSSPGDDRVAVSVADCRMTCFQTISDATEFWIKGEHFSPTRLLSNEDLAKTFDGGSLAIFRLAPQDYHRQVDSTLSAPQDISGEYYTVNPMAIRSKLDVYGENKRVVSTIQSKEFGTVAYVAIGAMMVGSINLTTNGNGHQVNRMDEHGYFAFGGSTIVLLFEPNSIQFDDDLLDTSRHQIEMLVKVGMKIGTSTRA
ncbi:hypothetical protein BGZ65_007452 [Modicella reniformis]|uniref:C2 domain-containing protein n=1 Tax=Modicella reniformis TaxID=1440133 RepID=A0A9P6LXQ6_9FUNG|nr:hypothetical protein BGZ65_007452 [Modicella reniformis]